MNVPINESSYIVPIKLMKHPIIKSPMKSMKYIINVLSFKNINDPMNERSYK